MNLFPVQVEAAGTYRVGVSNTYGGVMSAACLLAVVPRVTLVPVGSSLGRVCDVEIAGNLAFLATEDGLAVVDITDPTAPRQPNGTNGAAVIDISNPADPVVVGVLDTPGEALGVKVVGRHAFIADGPRGLQVADIWGKMLVGRSCSGA